MICRTKPQAERPASQLTYSHLCSVIPAGVNSPIRACKGLDHLPLVVESAEKDLIQDVDGNKFIDYCGSWGALIHGHAHPKILAAVQKRLEKGTTFGVTSAIEGQLASKVVQWIDSVEKIRFVSSGTEATMSAVRLARGYTGRNYIIKFNGNYHGHADFFLVKAGSCVAELSASSSAGIPAEVVKHVISLPFNDGEAVKKVFAELGDQIAAVILEPVAGNIGVVPAQPEFMELLRQETLEAGALLIFDEVITGFRLGLRGAQGMYSIKPDLTCFGKIIGGGFPAAAFGGRKEIMDFLAPLGPVFQAGTLSGNPIAMEAGLQTLVLAEQPGFYEKLEAKTQVIVQPVQEFILQNELPACIQQVGSMFTLFFGRRRVMNQEEAQQLDLPRFARFFRFMFAQGIYVPPSQHEAWFVSNAHEQEHLETTRDAILAFLNTEFNSL
ncbi:glutamate-1-semialdehyde 2,1-aminomutase [Parachlamydia acanthamoebae]|jgi:glutamate-1-semialdehyde 2,1-aminomutase|uniref:Glutamate-1-semialdehyde 2,1-aminomutase n=2 Tax=Parachlamydia acanthamoebae TaxID=83552 RepID=F8KZ77_PARAV|nr:glutamate-1-semialdehyde 2,1-aminomutase [Parachlamydia acanthamoebae]CCB86203.1 glutamate-1-semialdehyde 2,1-aminomutase [Parachlamydia acanthamoebae UV-7]